MRHVCTLLLLLFGNLVYLPITKHRKGLVRLYAGLLSVSVFLLAGGLFWSKLLDMAQLTSVASLIWLMFVLKGVIREEKQSCNARAFRYGIFVVQVVLLLTVGLAWGACLYRQRINHSDYGIAYDQPSLEKFNNWIFPLWRGRIVGSTRLCVRALGGSGRMYLACLIDKNVEGGKITVQFQVFGEDKEGLRYSELTKFATVGVDSENNSCVVTEENVVVRSIVNANVRGLPGCVIRFEYKDSFTELTLSF